MIHEDYKTHHGAWRTACEIALTHATDDADESYWQHQINTLDKIAASRQVYNDALVSSINAMAREIIYGFKAVAWRWHSKLVTSNRDEPTSWAVNTRPLDPHPQYEMEALFTENQMYWFKFAEREACIQLLQLWGTVDDTIKAIREQH